MDKSYPRPSTLAILTLALAAATLLLTPTPAGACGGGIGCWICPPSCSCQATGGSVWCFDCGQNETFDYVMVPRSLLKMTGPDRAVLQVFGYQTTKMDIGIGGVDASVACATAVPRLREIAGIDRIAMIEESNGRPIQALDFESHALPAAEFADLASSQGVAAGTDHAWDGFFTPVLDMVPDGIPVYFEVELRLSPGVTPKQLLRALRQEGYLATGGANIDGTLHQGHEILRSLNNLRLVRAKAPQGTNPGIDAQAPISSDAALTVDRPSRRPRQ